MSSGNFFLKKSLGEDFFQSLEKFELWKQGTKTVIDHEEIKTALKIVPRAILSFLIKNLSPMQIGESKELEIPVGQNSSGEMPILQVTKHERDVYSGEINDSTEKYTSKKVAEFKYRSIPGIGLVIMTAFELYDVDNLEKESHHVTPDVQDKVQKMIDERIALHDLIGKVVDKKIAERDAIQSLILAKLSENVEFEKKKKQITEIRDINESSTPQEDPYFRGMTNGIAVAESIATGEEARFVDEPKKMKKSSPLKGFLHERQNKLKKNEFKIELVKGECVNCPDCGQNIFNGEIFSGCVCYGDSGKVFLKKTENGFKVRFGKSWDPENIEMLLEVMRRKRG